MAPLTVVVLGPSTAVQGGVTTVQGMIAEGAPSDVSLHHIVAHDRGSELNRFFVALRALGELCRLRLSGRRVDAFHIHFGVRGSTWRACAFILLIRALFAEPVVLHAHGPDFHEFFARLPRPAQSFVRRVFQRSSGLIALSESWREYYEREFELPSEHVSVLYNPIKWREVNRGPDRHQAVRLVFLGQQGERKGVPTLLAAAAGLEGPDNGRWHLTLAGDGDVDGSIESVRRLGIDGCSTIHGWLGATDRDELLRNSDVFVLPTEHEGLPAALLEAMSFGLAVVTTPVGGIPEVVENEVNGLLVEPGDAPALTAALQRMIDDDALRARLAERGRESVEHLRIDRYWEALREVYHRAQGSCEALRPRRLEGAEVSAHAEDRASSPHSERE